MEEGYFEVKNSNGEMVLCQTLHTFSKNNINYIIYTDFETNEDDEIDILASRYKMVDNNMILEEIENDSEWELIDLEWNEVNKNG